MQRAGGGPGRTVKAGWHLSRAVSTADANSGVSATMVSRNARDLESGVVESGVGPSDASVWSDGWRRDTPGSYGSVSDPGSSEGSPRGGAAFGDEDRHRESRGPRHAKPPRESTSAWLWRVGEPVVFWTACTAVAAFSMYSMVRMTSSPGYPSAPPQGHDDRSVQVGTIANSSEAVGAYRGCEATSGGATLRNDKGTRRFPDFLLAGAAGAPADALAAFLEAKQVACAGKLEASLRNSSSAAHATGGFVSNDASLTSSDASSRLAASRLAAASASDDDASRALASSTLGWHPSRRWPSDDDGERFFVDPRWRRQPPPLDAQREYLDAHFHRCGEDPAFLSVPRFQLTRDLLYTGWAPLRMCEAMGGDDARVVAILTNPIDHAASVFAETLLEHRGAVARWATARAEETGGGGAAGRVARVEYSGRGFETAVDVDLHVARACGSDGLLLGTMDDAFEAKRRCCASAALEKGFAAWPGCPGGCSDAGLSEDERAACDERGELGFSPVRAGAWVDHLRRMYERVPAQNVMVVTADQAKRSGLPTLAVAVVGWRLLGLPLVDPASVSVDLRGARARAAAAAAARVGEGPNHDTGSLGGWDRAGRTGASERSRSSREAYEDALLAVFGGADRVSADGAPRLGRGRVAPMDAPEEPATAARDDSDDLYAAALPEAFLDACDDGVAISRATRERLASYHAAKVAELNALLGNGRVAWWDDETLDSVAATQEAAFLETRPGPYGTGKEGLTGGVEESAATGMTPLASLVRS